ncbi:hypothetical protein C5O97_18820 [Escherichia coli]|nr:hypothetical protein C5O97_18820 [Escherichia coli]
MNMMISYQELVRTFPRFNNNELDLITTISVPIRISNVISIPLIIPSTSCNFPTLELHIVQTPDAKKSHVHF